MERSPLELSFICPKKWSSMSPVAGGRYCLDCKKVVADHAKIPVSLLGDVLHVSEEGSCGNFKAYQLDRPFGDWRDKIVARYQRLSFSGAGHLPGKRLALFFVTLALFLSGCRATMKGKMRVDTHSGKKHHPNREQSALPPRGK